MKRYKVKYQLGDAYFWYLLESESVEAAEKEVSRRLKAFHGKNLLFKEFGFIVEAKILLVESF